MTLKIGDRVRLRVNLGETHSLAGTLATIAAVYFTDEGELIRTYPYEVVSDDDPSPEFPWPVFSHEIEEVTNEALAG
jgi:hypothetical protein